MSRILVRGASAVVVTVLLLIAAPAQAHVLLDAVRPHGDGTVDLVFSFDHGCEGQEPTDELTLRVPDHTVVLETAEPKGWQHRIDGDTIVWTGPGIPDGKRAEFVVTARVGASPGESVQFPVVQSCRGADSYEWTGAADDDPYPAPRFVATSASVDPTLLPAPEVPDSAGAGPGAVAAAVCALVSAAVALTWTVRRRRGN